MIEYESVAVFFRGAERLLVVLSGALSIWMGWNLFKSKIVPKGDGTVAVGNWKVELKQVGPGIFFAAFGAIILYGSWVTPLMLPDITMSKPPDSASPPSIEDGGKPPQEQQSSSGFTFLSSRERRSGRAFSLAVNELVHLSDEYCKEVKSDKPDCNLRLVSGIIQAVSYTHLRAHET